MGKKAILLAIVLLIISSFAVFNFYLGNKETSPAPPQQSVILPVEASDVTSVDSPDGKLTLTVKTTKGDGGMTYVFTVAGNVIFTATLNSSSTISIPANTWSPDGKYVFLKESGPGGVKFFALSAKTDSSGQNDQTANITDLFTQKYPDLKIYDVTGWGGVNLIIINSLSSDGSRGPSFWFEMPGKAIIRLSTRF